MYDLPGLLESHRAPLETRGELDHEDASVGTVKNGISKKWTMTKPGIHARYTARYKFSAEFAQERAKHLRMQMSFESGVGFSLQNIWEIIGSCQSAALK